MAIKKKSTALLLICILVVFAYFIIHAVQYYMMSTYSDSSAKSSSRTRQDLQNRIDELQSRVKNSAERLTSLIKLKKKSLMIQPIEGGILSRESKHHTETSTIDETKNNEYNIDGVEKLLSGFKGHRILTLNDEQLNSISFSEMMSWYGQSEGGGTCSGDFGNNLVTRWRATKKPVCSSEETAGAASAVSSAIDCYLVRQTRHHGNGDNLCVMRNVSVNMGLFADDLITRPVVETYVATM